MHRVLGDWFHWRIGSKAHFGFEKLGNCWSLIPKADKYAGVTFYSWWRFYFAINKF